MRNLGIKRKDLHSDCAPCSPEKKMEDYDNEEVFPTISTYNAAHAKALGLHILKPGKDYDLTVRVRLGGVDLDDKGMPKSGTLVVRAIEGFETEEEDDDAPAVVKALRNRKP